MSFAVTLRFILAARETDDAAARAEVRRYLARLDDEQLDALMSTAQVEPIPSLLDVVPPLRDPS